MINSTVISTFLLVDVLDGLGTHLFISIYIDSPSFEATKTFEIYEHILSVSNTLLTEAGIDSISGMGK